jgi:hypothetical protein
MQQNNDRDYATQHLYSCSEFMADLEPNIKIRDENDPSFMLILVPFDNGSFRTTGMMLG